MKHTLLTSLVAIGVASGAHANTTDVTFAGNYNLSNGDIANVGAILDGSTYTYTYNASDGSSQTAQYTVAPDQSLFTYTAPDNSTQSLADGIPSASEYTAASTYEEVLTYIPSLPDTLKINQEISAAADFSFDNYTYFGGDGVWVPLDISFGDDGRPMQENVAMDSIYASGHSVLVDGQHGALDTVDGNWYTYNDNGEVYHLSTDGGQLLDSQNNVHTPIVGSELETIFNEMQNAYNTDMAAVASAVISTQAMANTEQVNYSWAQHIATSDYGVIANLKRKYNTVTAAQNLYADAQQNQTAAADVYTADVALQNVARNLYNAPIQTTITDGANDAIAESVSNGSIKSAVDAAKQLAINHANDLDNELRAYVSNADTHLQNDINIEATTRANADTAIRAEFATADAQLQANIDAEAQARIDADNQIRSDFMAADAQLRNDIDAETTARIDADTALQSAIENEIARATAAENELRSGLELHEENVLRNARTYTDKQVSKLEDNMSAGIASTAALSSVAVSGVGAGEVSIGGGYGYYNGKSALALGAAMGVKKNWTINAGAGLGMNGGDVTIRAGTNYKFKAF